MFASHDTVQRETFTGENFSELVENINCLEKTFTSCLLVPLKDATPLNFTEKTSANSHKTSKFAQVFSLESFPLYGMCFLSFSPKTKNGWGLGMRLASFPGPAQLSVACSLRRLGHVQRRQLDKGLTQEGRVVPKHCRFTNLL